MVDEPVRLYSKQQRVAVDVIATQHREIHRQLERWGAWSRERRQQGHCRSIEHRFEAGGRDVKPPVVSLPPDPVLWRIDRAVRDMPMQHGDTIRMFYGKRCSPRTICVVLALRFEDFGTWMHTARCMVLNIMREQGFA